MDKAREMAALGGEIIENFIDDVIDEDFVVLDVEAKDSMDNVFRRMFGDVTKASAGRQFAIGGATGWLTGYVAYKVGKTVAIAIGSTVLILQIAQYNGIIRLDWSRVNYAMTKARARARAEVAKRQRGWINSAQQFYERNFFLGTGFATGFLFGFLI